MSEPLVAAPHLHGTAVDAWAVVEGAGLTALGVAAALYAIALWTSRRRSPWPLRRSACWFAGLACAALAIGPIARAAHESLTAHMAGHLLLGMVAPLLLVLGAPVTLALRALPIDEARALSRLLRRPPVRWLTHPVVAGLINVGGLWLLYGSASDEDGLFALMHGSAFVQAVVHLHVLLAGYLFTASLVGRDPDPHRAPLAVRAAVLLAFIAVHSMLAKWLFAHPPVGSDPVDAQAGAQLMYYGGDVVDVTLLVLLGLGWFAATRPRARAARPVAAA